MNRKVGRFIRIAIAALIAAGLLVSMEYVGNTKYSRLVSFNPISSSIVDTLLKRIEYLGDDRWDKNEYELIHSDLLLVRNHDIVNQSSYEDILYTLRLEYSESLSNEFNNWIRNCKTSSPERLYMEMTAFENYPGCKNILTNSIKSIERYRSAVRSQYEVVSIYSSVFDSKKFDRLIRRIESYTDDTELRKCNELVDQLYNSLGLLDEYKLYVLDFEAAFLAYSIDSLPGSVEKRNMRNFCPGPNGNSLTNRYTYYNNLLDSIGVCIQ